MKSVLNQPPMTVATELCAQTQTRYTISIDGNEVTDSTTGLIWRRCAEGMKMTADGCSGAATAFSSDQAQGWTKNEISTSGKPWRQTNTVWRCGDDNDVFALRIHCGCCAAFSTGGKTRRRIGSMGAHEGQH